jgi:hypothetical protein
VDGDEIFPTIQPDEKMKEESTSQFENGEENMIIRKILHNFSFGPLEKILNNVGMQKQISNPKSA